MPQIDINDSSDQKFVWVIPQKGGNEFSLKPFNQTCYLTCMETENDIKAVVREGESDEIDSGCVFRLDVDINLASKQSKGGIKAVVCEGESDDIDSDCAFRLDDDINLASKQSKGGNKAVVREEDGDEVDCAFVKRVS